MTAATQKRGNRKMLTGRVVSDKADKTIVVEVTSRVPHGLYRKVVQRRSRFAAHDAENSAHTGDTVQIMESRPMSKRKRWRLCQIVERAR
jgi:small subunit ribosomal protein S17